MTHREIEQQKTIDRKWEQHQSSLMARMTAVLGAQRAMVRKELGAGYALRQSLVDLAAIAELIADDLPAPRA